MKNLKKSLGIGALAMLSGLTGNVTAGNGLFDSIEGIYAIGRGGVTIMSDAEGNKFENGPGIQVGVGFEPDEDMDIQATFDYQVNNFESLAGDNKTDAKLIGMGLNVGVRQYLELDEFDEILGDFIPYIEGGAGLYRITVDVGNRDEHDTAFAFSGGVGVFKEFNENWNIEAGYRFRLLTGAEDFDFDDHETVEGLDSLKTHGFFAGIRYIW